VAPATHATPAPRATVAASTAVPPKTGTASDKISPSSGIIIFDTQQCIPEPTYFSYSRRAFNVADGWKKMKEPANNSRTCD